MTVAASYDPLYPLKGAVHVANDVLELVEIDIYQFLLCHSGKTAVFRHLQNRMMKVSERFLFAYISISIHLSLQPTGPPNGPLCLDSTLGHYRHAGDDGDWCSGCRLAAAASSRSFAADAE